MRSKFLLSIILTTTTLIIACGPKKSNGEVTEMDKDTTLAQPAVTVEADTVDNYAIQVYYNPAGNTDSIVIASDTFTLVTIPQGAERRYQRYPCRLPEEMQTSRWFI